MKLKLFLFAALLAVSVSSVTAAGLDQKDEKRKKKKKGEVAAVVAADTTKKAALKPAPDPKKVAYDKIVKGATTSQGLFTTYLSKEGKLYFELSAEDVDGRIFLLSNRIAKTSNAASFVAGQMVNDPFMIRFEVKDEKAIMYLVQYESVCREGDPMTPAFEKNFLDPVLKTFPQVASKGKNIVIDVTEFFGTPEKVITPVRSGGMPTPGAKSVGNRFNPKNSAIESSRAFPENIEIKTDMTFDSDGGTPYTITAHRSLIRLPKDPMKIRLQNKKFGYFSSDRTLFTTESDKVEGYSFIHRWKLEPQEKDMQKYLSGELVEPKKQIVYHVDTAFPAKWRSAIIQGINDWNIAFEKAGFKNAIIGKPYPSPKEDPNFDPDDMRYSCFKYAATAIANAMGPSYVDPRSGEILTGDVIWYHNVISLVHNWRFAQTAAVDKRVRSKVFDDELMWGCLRYVAAHEIGHTLGLMHNMGASSQFPVDSLRSATFTKKYGTTPSIMDYCRNNFVAQPGDFEKGVQMTPPVMGVFDELTIKWGYQYLPNTKPADEKPMLDKMVAAYKVYPKYDFGPQQFPATVDPRHQGEDLGNDHIRANDYGFKNLYLTILNLEKWTGERGEDYSDLKTNYRELVSQYSRMLGHVMAYIGGMEMNENIQGEKAPARRYVSKAQTKRAMNWLFKQARSNSWLTPSYVTTKLGFSPNVNDRINVSIIGSMLNGASLNRIYEGSKLGQNGVYSLEEYIGDFVNILMEPTINGKALTDNDMQMQMAAIEQIINFSDLKKQAAAAPQGGRSLAEEAYNNLQQEILEANILSPLYDYSAEEISFFRNTGMQPNISKVVASPLMVSTLKDILEIYKKALNTTDKRSKNFYEFQIIKITDILERK